MTAQAGSTGNQASVSFSLANPLTISIGKHAAPTDPSKPALRSSDPRKRLSWRALIATSDISSRAKPSGVSPSTSRTSHPPNTRAISTLSASHTISQKHRVRAYRDGRQAQIGVQAHSLSHDCSVFGAVSEKVQPAIDGINCISSELPLAVQRGKPEQDMAARHSILERARYPRLLKAPDVV